MKLSRKSSPPSRRKAGVPGQASSNGATALGAVTRPNEDALENGTTKVFTFFRDKLLAGELKAGDRLLGERELALSLSVSRPVLREALRSLAMLGLL